MNSKVKRTIAGAAAAAAAMAVLPLMAIAPAGAAAVNNGSLTLSPLGGNSSGNFTVNIGSGGTTCPGDTATDGYNVQGFVVPSGTNIDALTFNAIGPSVGQSLVDPGGTPLLFDTTEPVSAQLWHLPGTFTFANNSPGDFSSGAWVMGIACTQGSGAGMVKTYWSTNITITENTTTGGPAQIDWVQGAVPAAPTIGTVTPGDGTLSVAFTAAAADPAITSYSLTATPQGAGSPVTVSGAASPLQLTGLTNDTVYDLSLTATNAAGTSTAATATGTPAKPALAAPTVTATPDVNGTSVSWAGAGGTPTGYTVTVAPDPTGGPFSQTVTGTTLDIAGLTAGTEYTVTVTANYADPTDVGTPGTATVIPLSDGVLVQNIEATRPAGALVLTQDCQSDPTCTVDLGTGTLDASGTYYTATGTLYELTVTDTRDADTGWNVKGDLADTFSTTGDSFDSRALGWAPEVTYDAAAAPDGYDPSPVAGATVAPNTSDVIKNGTATLFSAPAGAGLGVSRATADLTLQIPVSAQAGTYTAQLAISVA